MFLLNESSLGGGSGCSVATYARRFQAQSLFDLLEGCAMFVCIPYMRGSLAWDCDPDGSVLLVVASDVFWCVGISIVRPLPLPFGLYSHACNRAASLTRECFCVCFWDGYQLFYVLLKWFALQSNHKECTHARQHTSIYLIAIWPTRKTLWCMYSNCVQYTFMPDLPARQSDIYGRLW